MQVGWYSEQVVSTNVQLATQKLVAAKSCNPLDPWEHIRNKLLNIPFRIEPLPIQVVPNSGWRGSAQIEDHTQFKSAYQIRSL